MQRFLLAMALTLLLAAPGWSQDAETPPETEEADAAAVEEEEPEAEEIDETGLDDQNYADMEDDDFRPSEDIPADQSIPFPTDI